MRRYKEAVDNELAVAVQALTEALKDRDKSQTEFQTKLLEELHELNNTVRHIKDRLAAREF